MYKMGQKSYIWPFWPIFSLLSHSNALNTTNEIQLRAHILQKVISNKYCQKLYSFLSFVWKCTKWAYRIFGHFGQFSAPLTHSKPFYITNEVHQILKSYIFPKKSTKYCYQKLYSFLTLGVWKCTKCAQKSYIRQFDQFSAPPP